MPNITTNHAITYTCKYCHSSVVTFHLILLCFHHKNCAKSHEQIKPLYLQIYTDFNPRYFQTIKSDRIAPYYELCHLHYKNCIVIFRVRVGCTMSVRLMVIDLIGLGDVIDLSVKP